MNGSQYSRSAGLEVDKLNVNALWMNGLQYSLSLGLEVDTLNEDTISSLQNASMGYKLASGNTIRKLLKEGRLADAFEAADFTSQQGPLISTSIAFCLLQGCIEKKDLSVTKKLHGFLQCNGFLSNPFIGCHLIRAYAECKCLSEARHVFYSLPEQDVFTWTAITSAHEELGQFELAISLYHHMQDSNVEADEYSFVAVLRACTRIETLTQGMLVHAHVIFSGLEGCVHVGSALVDMYSKCGSFEDSEIVLSNLPKPSAVSWNSLIGGCAQRGHDHQALLLFYKMQNHGIEPNAITYVAILQACSNLTCIVQGILIHVAATENKLELDAFVASILIDMYSRCGSLRDAQRVFEMSSKHDLVTWSAMMTGYTHHCQGNEAVSLFEQLVQEGMEPNDGIFVSTLKACTCTSFDYNGYYIHGYIVETGYDADKAVRCTLIDMHMKRGSLQDACHMFANVVERGVVPWTCMMAGYCQHGFGQESLRLFERMQEEAQLPNVVTFVCVLNACAATVALSQGRLFHARLIASGCGLEELAGIALINLYKSCGSLMSAATIFDHLPKHKIEMWTAIIAACAEHYDFKLALIYFEKMKQKGLKPDDIAFLSLLSACCNGGQVYDGCLLFKSIEESYSLTLRNEHYNSMISLLGSSGYLREAEDLMATMPRLPNDVAWTALLFHCKTHNIAQLGERCFAGVAAMDHNKAAAHKYER